MLSYREWYSHCAGTGKSLAEYFQMKTSPLTERNIDECYDMVVWITGVSKKAFKDDLVHEACSTYATRCVYNDTRENVYEKNLSSVSNSLRQLWQKYYEYGKRHLDDTFKIVEDYANMTLKLVQYRRLISIYLDRDMDWGRLTTLRDLNKAFEVYTRLMGWVGTGYEREYKPAIQRILKSKVGTQQKVVQLREYMVSYMLTHTEKGKIEF